MERDIREVQQSLGNAVETDIEPEPRFELPSNDEAKKEIIKLLWNKIQTGKATLGEIQLFIELRGMIHKKFTKKKKHDISDYERKILEKADEHTSDSRDEQVS